MTRCIVFVLLLLSHLNEQNEATTWISFDDYLGIKNNKQSDPESPDTANIVQVPCNEGYARIGTKCRKKFVGCGKSIFKADPELHEIINQDTCPTSQKRIIIKRLQQPTSQKRIIIERLQQIKSSKGRLILSQKRIIIERLQQIKSSKGRLILSQKRIIIERLQQPTSQKRIIIERLQQIKSLKGRLILSQKRIIIERLQQIKSSKGQILPFSILLNQTSSEMTELTKLKNQRKIIKAAITRIQNNVKDDDSVPELDARLLDLKERLKDYNNIQNQIESLQIIDAEHNESYWESENDKERTSVENQYYKTLGKIKGIIIENSPATSNPSLTPNSTTINIRNDGNKLEANEHSDEYKTNHLECEKHSVENTTRMSSEQFVVKLPVKDLHLGESRPRAVKQFLNLENRPDKDHKLKSGDKEFMLEYRGLNYTELVPFNTLEFPNSYCLPHQNSSQVAYHQEVNTQNFVFISIIMLRVKT
ncbi:hypothetical protein Zmor_010208 [Zophobas morio]|uniref:Uncharacterized protein n=1 Tax=Zophobas morio TaxID=2755281 RepID=A0AA38ING4_9CUCU|nr:hypothetical protein Zmor_010208 [Zophobas morio]